jgi:phosphotransferase system HPr (HPr) family protein
MSSGAPPQVREAEVVLSNRHGLHLRPATRFAQVALRFRSEVTVVASGQEVNGKSILMLTSLAAERGTRLRIRAEGDDADQCLAALEALVNERFGEDAPAG